MQSMSDASCPTHPLKQPATPPGLFLKRPHLPGPSKNLASVGAQVAWSELSWALDLACGAAFSSLATLVMLRHQAKASRDAFEVKTKAGHGDEHVPHFR